MKTITLHEDNLKKAFKGADKQGQKLLIALYPELQSKGEITDRIKTFEDACRELDECPIELLANYPSDVIDYKMACIICKALNEGWTPDWENTNQYKWFPWFNMKGGFGFSFSPCTYPGTCASVGSRLCFKTEALANYAGKQFESIYKNLLTL